MKIRRKHALRIIKGDDISGMGTSLVERWSDEKKKEKDESRFSLKEIMWSPFKSEKAERKLVKDTLECKRAID